MGSIFLEEALSTLFESAEFPSYFKADQLRQGIVSDLFRAKFKQRCTNTEDASPAQAKIHICLIVDHVGVTKVSRAV